MKASLLLLLALVAPLSAQELLKLPTLTTKAGKTYKAVTVTAKRDDGISIMHEGGSTRIRFEDLPYSVTSKLGPFDSEKAKELRAQEEAKQKAMLDEIDRGLAQKAKEGTASSTKSTDIPADPKPGPAFAIRDNQKITAKIIKYRSGTLDRMIEVTARAGTKPLTIDGSGGKKTVKPGEVLVWSFWTSEKYQIIASEDGKEVDRETARKKEGLTTDNKL